MIPARSPIPRHPRARLLVADGCGRLHGVPRTELAAILRPHDVLVANDAGTMPASLTGVHDPTGAAVELRLAARATLDPLAVHEFTAVVFGAGNYRTRTEDRMPPPPVEAGDRLTLGPLRATVLGPLGHPRLVRVRFEGDAGVIWAGIARHGRPIQYAHVPEPLAMWDVWTCVAARPVAFEPPSAGFVLDWRLLGALHRRGVAFSALTLAAGISSTGDPALDARFPLDEAYEVPRATVDAIMRARAGGGRVVALGTTVARGLEHAARDGALRAGPGLATQRLGPDSTLRVVDAIVTGTHEPDEPHYRLLRAFTSAATLRTMSVRLDRDGYRSHEFGDSILIERLRCAEARHPDEARRVA